VSANGLEMTTAQSQTELRRIKSLFRFLPDSAMVHEEWERLVAQQAVSGKNTYDARLVAAMIVHGINEVLIFNGGDFKRYSGITILAPAALK